MTREEAIKILNTVLLFGKCDCPKKDIEGCLKMAIKALEQVPILDKIRAEIEQGYCEVNNDYDHGRNYGLYMATQIIDKYKAETEDT